MNNLKSMLREHFQSSYDRIYVHFSLWWCIQSWFYLIFWHISLLEEVERSTNLDYPGESARISLPVVFFLHCIGSGPLLTIWALKTTGGYRPHVQLDPFALKWMTSETCYCDQETAASNKEDSIDIFDLHSRNQLEEVKQEKRERSCWLLISSC